MKITDKRAARVWLTNGSSASVTFLTIPLSAFVDYDGSRTLATDRTDKITVPANSRTVIDIPAGYRIGVKQNEGQDFFCSTFGANPLTTASVGDHAEPGEVSYAVTTTCAQQGDIIMAVVSEGE